MKLRLPIYSGLLAILLSLCLLLPVQAQDKKNPKNPAPTTATGTSNPTTEDVTKRSGPGRKRVTPLRAPTDALRKCEHRANQDRIAKARADAAKGSKRLLTGLSLGNNPREGQYRAEMERLLGIEIKNVRNAILEVAGKHKEIIVLYPQLKNYQEIILEDFPGTFRDGAYVNTKKMIIMHYGDTGKLDCVVLESFTREIYQTHHWTRKLVRLYYPHVQLMELETHKHNYKLYGTLDKASPEIQIRALRLVFVNLRSALYTMDMMIAGYYDLRERKNDWQIDL